MSSEYMMLPLGAVAKVRSGYAFKSLDMGAEGHPLIKIGNIEPPLVQIKDCDRISSDVIRKTPNSERYVLREGDILIAMTGATAGKTGRLPETNEVCYLNQRVGKVYLTDSSLIDYNYLYQVLSRQGFADEILALADGSAQGNVSGALIETYEIPIPPSPIQKAIAHILGTLDDKIELNRKTNETLEAMAKALFQSWFVDFDPVRAKADGRPTGLPDEISELFPDSFEESELGEIPAGWEISSLYEIAINPRETAKPGEMDSSDRYIGLEHMPRGSICLGESGEAEDLESTKNRFREGDVLFGKLRPYFKKTGYAQFDGVCSTDIVVVRMRGESGAGFVCCLLASDPFVNFTVAASTGTRMPRTSWSDMCEFPFAIPTPLLLKEFDNQFCRLIERIRFGCDHSSHLASARDTLLPKLISGELRIPEAEKLLEQAGV